MIADNESTGATSTCMMEISPGLVDAGGAITLQGTVTCTPPGDLRDAELVIRDEHGAVLHTAVFTEFDGVSSRTEPFVVTAPPAAGSYTWLATAPAIEEGAEAVSAEFVVEVKAHSMSLVVWDVPATVVAGETFRIKVGSKCSSGCKIADRTVEIHDHAGERIATAQLSDEPWPKTAALYAAEVELQAPDEAGLVRWEARTSGSDAGLPHAEGAAAFSVRFVDAPDFVVTVEAIDRAKRTPVRGAQVVMHPYRAVTDAEGLTEVRVPKGDYTMFISGPRYFPVRLPVSVTQNMTTKAELTLEPPIERN
jgi:hypothetical protein